ncbi:AfaD family invasin [Escherichia coli]|nr:AfaD family invasin [Escherichia coli]
MQGRRDSRHELRVRIAGEGWSPSVTGGQEGMVSYGQRDRAF